MTIEVRNIFALVPPATPREQLTVLLMKTNMHLERIVSHAHASPEGFWYDQEWAEWVIVLKGSAGRYFERQSAPRVHHAGDYLEIAPHPRHRVARPEAPEPK